MYPGESQNEIARRHSTHGLRQVCGGRLINGRFCEQLPFAAAAGIGSAGWRAAIPDLVAVCGLSTIELTFNCREADPKRQNWAFLVEGRGGGDH